MCYFKEKSAYIVFALLFLAIFIASPQLVYSQIEFDEVAPNILMGQIFPLNGQTNVPVDSTVEVVFSETMDPLFYPLSITGINGVTTWMDYILVFSPDTRFNDNTTYNVYVDSNQAFDLAGNSLDQSYEWSFVTEISPWTNFDHIQDLSLDQNRVELIFSEDNGDIWVVLSSSETSDDLYVFDGYDPNGFYKFNEPLGQINAIEQDSAGNIWVASEAIEPDLGGVYMYDGTDWIQYNSPTDANFPDNTTKCLTIGPDDNVWVGTGSSGMYRHDGISWTNYDMTNSGLSGNWVSNIAVDENNYIWIATAVGGIEGFDPQADTNAWTNYTSTIEDQLDISFGTFPLVGEIVSSPGNIWAVTDIGLLRYDSASDTWGLFEEYSELNSIAWDDSKALLWIGTDEGLISFDGLNEELIPMWDVGPEVNEVTVDVNGNIWAGTDDSLSKYDVSPPLILSFSPTDNKKDVNRKTNITVLFSEPMDKNSVISALSFSPSFSYTSSWNASSTKLTINPKSDLNYDKKYKITLDTKAIDKQGNPLPDSRSSSFTTESKPISQYQIPSFPQYQIPTFPRYQIPTSFRYQIPTSFRYQVPTFPQYQIPRFPQYQIPTFPRYQIPTFPQYQIPTFPRYQIHSWTSSSPFRTFGTLTYPR